jgi:hypothetical protein
LAVCAGKFYMELRVLTAQGSAGVGFAGTSFRLGLDSEGYPGEDEMAWAYYAHSGKLGHGCAARLTSACGWA